jgi:hypothetical protein
MMGELAKFSSSMTLSCAMIFVACGQHDRGQSDGAAQDEETRLALTVRATLAADRRDCDRDDAEPGKQRADSHDDEEVADWCRILTRRGERR